MGDDAGSGEAGSDDPATTDGEATDEEPAPPRVSDDGILLAIAAAACLLAAATARTTDQFAFVAWLAALAGGAAVVAVAVDVAVDYVPGSRVHLLVGAVALLGALLAVPGRHWANVATLGAAAALVLWRVVDVEIRGTSR